MTVPTTHEVPVLTREEAIVHVVKSLTTFTLQSGAELASILGPEVAAELAIAASQYDLGAIQALGVTQDEIREIFSNLGDE